MSLLFLIYTSDFIDYIFIESILNKQIFLLLSLEVRERTNFYGEPAL